MYWKRKQPSRDCIQLSGHMELLLSTESMVRQAVTKTRVLILTDCREENITIKWNKRER